MSFQTLNRVMAVGVRAFSAQALQAAAITYVASDPGTTNGSATPNSDAAAALFDAAAGALGTVNLIDFENAALGSFSSLEITSITFDTRNPSNTAGDFIGLDDIRDVAAAVPEPGTLALFGLGLACRGLRRRRG